MKGLALWAALVACADLSEEPFFPTPPLKGVPPPELTRLREDFNNRRLISTETGDAIIVDINRGLVTLKAEDFPDVSGIGTRTYAEPIQQNGLIEAESIDIDPTSTFEASDSVELRAADKVTIQGDLNVGRGGITIAAGNLVQIDGSITSEGPVRIMLGNDAGSVEINGRISARSTLVGPAPISIRGRGTAIIRGELFGLADPGAPGGDIVINTYGDIIVAGSSVRIHTTADQGAAGVIRLESESVVEIQQGAWVGVPAETEIVPGGNVEVRASRIVIGDGVRIAASGTNARTGGALHLTAETTIETGNGAFLGAGYAPDGGSVFLTADGIDLGAETRVEGGRGTTQAGLVTLRAVSSLHLDAAARVTGGQGACSPGGDIIVEVGGVVTAAEGAAVIGGAGNTDMCGRDHAGGSVSVVAREIYGAEETFLPGTGAIPGSVDVVIDPMFTVNSPNLAVGTGGVVESKTIDRGEAAASSIPRLVSIETLTPERTTVDLLLAGAFDLEGPFDVWLPVTSESNHAELSGLVGARYLRYRVVLRGRTFDAPVIDYFEIDLAPKGF